MLNQIYIRDLATIEELHLNFSNGCTMISGETGAGKSIFIEAIELALGGRASQNIIRPGKDKADISLSFDITNFPKVIACLKNLDLDQDTAECIIRRVITSDGRSRSYVNGLPSTLQFVKELGELLFHLHSQHEQQVLLKADTQREMLDRFANHLPLVTQVKVYAEEWRIVDQQIKQLKEKTSEYRERADYLRFQLEELEAVKLQPGEWEALETEHRRLIHAEELIRNIQQAVNQISDDNEQNIILLLNDVRKTLDAIHPLEARTHEWITTLHTILIQITDLESDLKNYLENTDLDPEKLQLIEARVSEIFNLSRKHKISPHELIPLKEKFISELQLIDTSDENLIKLKAQQVEIAKNYSEYADRLSLSRKKAAITLENEISLTIQSLSLPHCEFKIKLEAENGTMPSHGKEKIVFLIKTNPEQSLQPLVKVISGGELSRLSLAAHLALANQTSIPTLVFDEVDTGLSGATAEKIGRLLRKLGESYQVFCITHQPQVAACGHHHVLVEKNFLDNSTHTSLRLLSSAEKTQEIARMLGGEKITEKTLEHAQEVLRSVR